MKWLESTGGPFVLAAESVLPDWLGCDGDYDRAREIDDWLGVLDVGNAQALVVNDEPMRTTRLIRPGLCLLVRWSHAPNEQTVVRHLERASQLVFPRSSVVVDFGSRNGVLFDSAVAGARLDSQESLRVELPTARCAVHTLDWKAADDTRLVLHTLRALE